MYIADEFFLNTSNRIRLGVVLETNAMSSIAPQLLLLMYDQLLLLLCLSSKQIIN
jgi:hypothetical protein